MPERRELLGIDGPDDAATDAVKSAEDAGGNVLFCDEAVKLGGVKLDAAHNGGT